MSAGWVRRRAPRPGARVRMLCFPHAGGSAGFFGRWATGAPEEIEVAAVQYPGREDRIREAPIDRMDALADAAVDAVAPYLDRPTVLFGHSMGAAVAFEVARRLEARRSPAEHLVVSGRHAPRELRDDDVHLRDDDGVVAELVRLGGVDADLLADPGLREVVLPAVRADFALAETYRPEPDRGPELRCPLTAVIGDADPEVDESAARRWAEHTRTSFALHVLPGDHFYLGPRRDEVLAIVRERLGDQGLLGTRA